MRHVSKAKLSLAVALAIAGSVMPNMMVDAAYTAPYTNNADIVANSDDMIRVFPEYDKNRIIGQKVLLLMPMELVKY